MRRSKNVGVALIGLLVVAAISMAGGSGRKPATEEETQAHIRVLAEAEAVQISKRFPGLRVRSQVSDRLLDSLFPNTAFYKALNRSGTPPIPYLLAISNDSLFTMPDGFNRLLRTHDMEVNDKNIVHLAKAFVILAVGNEPIVDTATGDLGGLDSFPQITFLEGCKTEQHDERLPTAVDVIVVCRIGGGDVQTWEFSVSRHTPRKGEWVKVGQFGVVHLVIGGKPIREYLPVNTKEEARRGAVDSDPWVEIDVTAGNATVEQEGYYSHYYLTTYRDGTPTDYWVRLRLYGFDSCEAYVYVRVEPKYPYTYGPDTLLGPIQIDGSGEGSWDWTPNAGTQTGIASVCAGNMPPGDTFNQRTPLPDNRELTLEKEVTGIFPGAGDENLAVKYCNQFFVNHQGQGHASVFARYVDSAMQKSWRMQVETWSLGTPPDSDHVHQVFINDGANWYHTAPVTWSEFGPDRKIAILSWIWHFTNTDKAYSSESIRVHVAVAHEFYHGVQWGLDSAKVIDSTWNWFTEGQARFMQSAQYPNEEFDTSSVWGKRQYARDANKYLTRYPNTSLRTLSEAESIGGYPCCLFWRFMYERFGRDSGGIQLVRDCYAESVGTGNSIIGGKAAIDSAIAKYWRSHPWPPPPGRDTSRNFLQTLDGFAVACYLNDVPGQWYDPNGVYSRPSLTADTAFKLGANETDSITVSDDVPCSYGVDFVQVALNGNVDTLRILMTSKSRNPDVTLKGWLVKVYPFACPTPFAVESLEYATPGGGLYDTQGAIRVCLVVTRHDTVDTASGPYDATFKVTRAIAVTGLLPVTDTVIAGTEFTPKAVVANRGWMKEVFPATFTIQGTAYSDTKSCTLDVGDSATIVFDPWTTTKGFHSTCCSVYIACDTTRSDDVLRGSLVALADTWQVRPDVPDSVSIGGALAAVGDTLIYALRGGRTRDFYRYDVRSRDWDTMASLPYDITTGAALTWDRGAYVYAVRGCSVWNLLDTTYRHEELLRYNIEYDSWDVASTLPLKSLWFSSLVYGGDDCLYLLGAGDTVDIYRAFFRYHAGAWSRLADVPERYGLGASMCWDQAGHIYVLCSNDDTAFCQYDIGANTWCVKPRCCPVKSYSALAYDSVGNRILALKGWYWPDYTDEYDPVSNTWLQDYHYWLPRPVGFGCALARCAGFLYCLRGDNKHDFWRYAPISRGESRLAAAVDEPAISLGVACNRFEVSPNPTRGAAQVQWQVGEPGPVTLRVFDNAGRVVRTIQNGYQTAGRYSARWDGTCDNGRRAASGIFFYCLDAPGFHKIVKVAAVGR